MNTLAICRPTTGPRSDARGGGALPRALLSPFFDTIITMVNTGELSEGQEYRIPLPVDRAGRTLTLSIVRPQEQPPQGAGLYRGGLRPRQLRLVMDYIDKNMSETISLPTLASMAGLSPSHFIRAFKASVARTPHAHIIRLRIERAMAMLAETDEPLSQIALACGFSDQSHLTKRFRRLVGTSPSRWRRARTRAGFALAPAA